MKRVASLALAIGMTLPAVAQAQSQAMQRIEYLGQCTHTLNNEQLSITYSGSTSTQYPNNEVWVVAYIDYGQHLPVQIDVARLHKRTSMLELSNGDMVPKSNCVYMSENLMERVQRVVR